MKQKNNVQFQFLDKDELIIQLASNQYGMCILTNKGKLYVTTSHNSLFGLSDDINAKSKFIYIKDNIKEVSCVHTHTMIIDNNDKLWGVGYNRFYQLGLEDSMDRDELTFIRDNVKHITCGDYNTLIINNNDELECVGTNKYDGFLKK